MSGRAVNALKLALVVVTLLSAVVMNGAGFAAFENPRATAQTSAPQQQPPPPPKSDPTPQATPPAQPAPAATQAAPAAAPSDAQTFDQEKALAALRAAIAGREERPAEEVFKNIQVMKGVPAGRLLAIMRMGYARSLGVNCTHCHVAGQWESDDKPTKQVAREMILMTRAVNNDLLKKIKNLKSESPAVNCTTCHRGQTKPALNLPEPPRQ